MNRITLKVYFVIMIMLVSMIGCQKSSEPISGEEVSFTKSGVYTQVSNFGSNPGSLNMYKYVPDNVSASAPLVIALHGCMQTAANYRDSTEWNKLADRFGFYVVYGEETLNGMSCFRWYDYNRTNEAQSVANMATYMKNNYSIDSSKVFVTGLSAGGGLAVNVIALHQNDFAAAAVMSGLPHGASSGSMLSPQDGSAVTCGAQCPKVIVFHGTGDTTVVPGNAEKIRNQWTSAHSTDNIADNGGSQLKPGHTGHTYEEYDKNGETVVAVAYITGMGHAITVDPGTGDEQGGTTGSFSEDNDLYSSYYAAQFFGILQSGPQPLSVNITSPANGAVLQLTAGSAVIQAATTGENTITKVEFFVNNSKIGEDTSAPYEIAWNYSAVGSYSLKAVVIDSTSATETDDDTIVTVSEFTCQDWTATNQSHVSAGRAEQYGYVYAKTIGAGDELGLYYSDTTTVKETSPGYFEEGECSGGSEDTQAPVVNVTAPANNANLSGIITVSADASDNVGVTKVEFYAGSTKIGEDTTAPYSISWDTASIADGNYTIKAKAFDAANNSAEDADTGVMVENGGSGCTDYIATNADHTTAGRAVLMYGILYYTVGANAYIGIGAATETTLKETSPGYYELGACN